MQIDKIIKLMQSDQSVDAPPDAVERAKNIFRQAVREPKRSLMHRIVAVLSADLAPNKAAFGERSASALKTRQLLFTAGDTAIDLRLSMTGAKMDMHGQLLADELSSGQVKLFNPDRMLEAETDEFGEFRLVSIDAGDYSMIISLGDKEIYIERIDLQ